MNSQKTILVTGGAGYIGSHVVLSLQQSGYRVIVLDNLVYGHRDIVESVLLAELIIGDISDRQCIDRIFIDYKIDAVMHFAAYAYVGESMIYPARYYRNNFIGTFTLLEAMLTAKVKTFVFSSTCATYGLPSTIPISETHSQNPINPYGMSKLMIEKVLKDFDQAYNFKSVIFRYFNAAGADPSGCLGEDHTPETHLIPLVLFTALGKRDNISIFGTNYDTHDGTCIRDYIHVSDLANAHVLGLEYLLKGNKTAVFNLGNGNGFSVQEIIKAARRVTGIEIPVIMTKRRLGDPPILVGSSEKAKKVLGWQPQNTEINTILENAWKWHQQRHGS